MAPLNCLQKIDSFLMNKFIHEKLHNIHFKLYKLWKHRSSNYRDFKVNILTLYQHSRAITCDTVHISGCFSFSLFFQALDFFFKQAYPTKAPPDQQISL